MSDIAEKNARVTARGDYVRWLAKRFGGLDLLLTLQGEDRVSLRKVYVPLRLDTEDRTDESMPGPAEAKDEPLPGRDALEVIAEQPFVAISGRPGSGKTTLIQAIIDELASDRPSDFRRRIVGDRGILPIPLILRDYQNELETVETLADLLDLWWKRAEQEARDKGYRLDVARLRASYASSGDGIPLLLLFDGIDEAGGPSIRAQLALCAQAGLNAGHRVVFAGRPQGFSELRLDEATYRQFQRTEAQQLGGGAIPGAFIGAMIGGPALGLLGALFGGAATQQTRVQLTSQAQPIDATLRHLQPFGLAQIKTFVDRFYRLRDEWRLEREQFIRDFETALTDANRAHLLTLARRPHFLTLMALVHANDRRMPHGRADLYRRIIDLYLIRQTHQRRLQFTTRGEPMPHWDEREVRRALGYLAWRSQLKGAEVKDAASERDKRQVIWTRAELEQELCELLGGDNRDFGRFSDLKPGDASRLVDYFLHPTGLLVDPAEDRLQFAHLSFQEYLCAEYIHGRAKSRGTRRFLDAIKELLYANLGLPGWDEVGLLLLCIHAAEGVQTDPNAHLELLAELDPADLPQARLLVAALTGKELDFADGERLRWLPVAVAAALVQPEAEIGMSFRALPEWAEPGRALLFDLFVAENPFDVLSARPGAWLSASECRECGPIAAARLRWASSPTDDGWRAEFGRVEAWSHSLLGLANSSGWLADAQVSGQRANVVKPEATRIVLGWLRRQIVLDNECELYCREVTDRCWLPVATRTVMELDALIPHSQELTSLICSKVPVDLSLLQSEGSWFVNYLPSQAAILYSVGGFLGNLSRSVLVAGLFQCVLIAESSGHVGMVAFLDDRLALRVESMPFRRWVSAIQRHLMLSGPMFRSIDAAKSLGLVKSSKRTSLRDGWRSGLHFEASMRSSEVSRWCERHALSGVANILGELAIRSLQLPESERTRVEACLTCFGHRAAALDWFNEQAEDPDLMRRRGLRPGQPLPPEFGLFDDTGRLNPQMPRAGVVRLREWVDDDDAVLGWFFPEGLSAEDDKDLREQLHILHHYERPDGGHGQPWSPKAALDAVLADWPEDEPFREVTLEAAERDMIAALDALLPPEE
jgi:hypothetical protein